MGNYLAAILQDAPIGVWRLNEIANLPQDSSGYGRAATSILATITYRQPSAVYNDPTAFSFAFDGVTGAVDLGSDPSFKLTTGTIEAWAKTSDAGGGYRAIFTKPNAFGLFMRNNHLIAYDWGVPTDRDSGATINDGNWHHIALTFQSGVANGSQLYKDGVAVGPTFTMTVSNQFSDLGLSNNAQSWPGSLAEAAIYSIVLTPAQIVAHFRAGSSAVATVLAVMKGIETNLKTIPNLVTDYIVPDGVTPPMAVVGVPPISDYHGTFAHGKFYLEPTVTILTSKAYDRTGQEMLAGFADPASSTSIHAAIESDRTLGGTVDDCILIDFRPLHSEEVGAIGYYGGVFTLKVIARGA